MHKEIQKQLFQSDLANAQFVEPENRNEPIKSSETKGLQDQFYKLSNIINEQLKSQNLKFDKLAQALHRLELSHSGMIHETAEKIANLNGRISERRAVDFRIQEMIDRHNMVLQSYEVRLSQLQKVISEKEAAILSLKAHLNDARVEISRLRR